MRKLSVICIVMLLVGCSYFGTIQQKWDNLTSDEKARIIVNDMQGQLDNLFNAGKVYVTANPKYAGEWKGKIVPAFDTANKSLATVIALGSKATPDILYSKIQPQITSIVNMLIAIGAIKQ